MSVCMCAKSIYGRAPSERSGGREGRRAGRAEGPPAWGSKEARDAHAHFTALAKPGRATSHFGATVMLRPMYTRALQIQVAYATRWYRSHGRHVTRLPMKPGSPMGYCDTKTPLSVL